MAVIRNDTLEHHLHSMKKIYVWNVRSDEEGLLRFDIGEPNLIIGDRLIKDFKSTAVRRVVTVAGKYHFYIDNCRWYLHNIDSPVLYNDSDLFVSDKQRQLCILSGQKIEEINYIPNHAEWLLTFDLGSQLGLIDRNTMQYPDESQWSVFVDDGTIISYNSNGGKLSMLKNK